MVSRKFIAEQGATDVEKSPEWGPTNHKRLRTTGLDESTCVVNSFIAVEKSVSDGVLKSQSATVCTLLLLNQNAIDDLI